MAGYGWGREEDEAKERTGCAWGGKKEEDKENLMPQTRSVTAFSDGMSASSTRANSRTQICAGAQICPADTCGQLDALQVECGLLL